MMLWISELLVKCQVLLGDPTAPLNNWELRPNMILVQISGTEQVNMDSIDPTFA
jgi:hypothetical protein